MRYLSILFVAMALVFSSGCVVPGDRQVMKQQQAFAHKFYAEGVEALSPEADKNMECADHTVKFHAPNEADRPATVEAADQALTAARLQHRVLSGLKWAATKAWDWFKGTPWGAGIAATLGPVAAWLWKKKKDGEKKLVQAGEILGDTEACLAATIKGVEKDGSATVKEAISKMAGKAGIGDILNGFVQNLTS